MDTEKIKEELQPYQFDVVEAGFDEGYWIQEANEETKELEHGDQ